MKNLSWILAVGMAFASIMPAHAELDRLEIMIISGPGSGQDQFARAVAEVLRTDKLASGIQINAVPGGGGSTGLVRFARSGSENGSALYTLGAATMLFTLINPTDVKPQDLVPIVRLVGDYPVMAVRADSDIKSLNDVIDRLKKDPGGVRHGGSEAGTADHIFYARLAENLGVDVTKLNHIGHPNTGEVVVSLLSKQVDVASGTAQDFAGQVAAGKVRFLAIAAPERIAGVDAPTFKELGIDLVMPVSRGFMARPTITKEEKAGLEDAFAKLHSSPHWQELLKNRGWTDQYQTSAEYGDYIASETRSYSQILTKLGFIK